MGAARLDPRSEERRLVGVLERPGEAVDEGRATKTCTGKFTTSWRKLQEKSTTELTTGTADGHFSIGPCILETMVMVNGLCRPIPIALAISLSKS